MPFLKQADYDGFRNGAFGDRKKTHLFKVG